MAAERSSDETWEELRTKFQSLVGTSKLSETLAGTALAMAQYLIVEINPTPEETRRKVAKHAISMFAALDRVCVRLEAKIGKLSDPEIAPSETDDRP